MSSTSLAVSRLSITDLGNVNAHSIRPVPVRWREEREHRKVDGLTRCGTAVDRYEEAVGDIRRRRCRPEAQVDLGPACGRAMNGRPSGGERRSVAVRSEADRQRPGERGRRWEAIVEGGPVRPGRVNLNPCSAVSETEEMVREAPRNGTPTPKACVGKSDGSRRPARDGELQRVGQGVGNGG